MPQVLLSKVAVEDLERLIITHSLPADTKERFKRAVRTLERFPRIGRQLEGRWAAFRAILGPWRWMLVVYVYDEEDDVVLITTVQDARSSRAATPR